MGTRGSNTNGNSPRKGKGPTASAAGPLKPGQKPLQCYKCGGWGPHVQGCKVTGLIDSGANISISKCFAEKLGLPCRQLWQLLEIEGSGGIDVPYLGYTDINFQVPGVKALNEDILVVIQNDGAYSSRVPIMLGTLHIDMVIEKATSEELQNLGKEWKTGVLGAKVEAR